MLREGDFNRIVDFLRRLHGERAHLMAIHRALFLESIGEVRAAELWREVANRCSAQP